MGSARAEDAVSHKHGVRAAPRPRWLLTQSRGASPGLAALRACSDSGLWSALPSKEAEESGFGFSCLFSVRVSHTTPWLTSYFKPEHFYIQNEGKMCRRHRSRRDGLLMGRGSPEPESHFAASCPFFTHLQPSVLVRFLALPTPPN